MAKGDWTEVAPVQQQSLLHRSVLVDLGRRVTLLASGLRDVDGEGAARDVVCAPADDQCVLSLLGRRVRHLVGGRSLFLHRQIVHEMSRRRHHTQRQQRLACN